MADVSLYKGGTPVINYMWCEKDYAQFRPPFGHHGISETPPYDSHMDGAYGSGLAYFTMGMPVKPNRGKTGGMLWQKKALADKDPQVDDYIDLLVVPQNHYVTAINFKIMAPDAHMAGATVSLTGRRLTYQSDGTYELEEITDIADALAVQGQSATIALDVPSNTFVSTVSIVSPGESETGGSYAVPLYANPTVPPATESGTPTFGSDLIIGVKVVSLPTDTNFKLHNMLNGWYLSAKVAGFECPTYY